MATSWLSEPFHLGDAHLYRVRASATGALTRERFSLAIPPRREHGDSGLLSSSASEGEDSYDSSAVTPCLDLCGLHGHVHHLQRCKPRRGKQEDQRSGHPVGEG